MAAHQLTGEQVLVRDDVHAVRFDGCAGCVFAQSLDDVLVLHGSVPALEGKPASPAKNESGRLVTDMIQDAVRNGADRDIRCVEAS